ncbi:MAG: EpsD family peptidyl-prolyl cis-trans isomerase [Gammaproteobacteria bacterium]|nr:EpsD family peptidyl-prolyl cis-trans isomerase [Gammaproteobacteria bacterium]
MNCGRVILVVLLSSVLLTACGSKKEGGSQVAAKVNGDEISVHQINYAMARLGNIPKGKEDEAGKQILKGLVDQQLLVKRAVDKKLDRNPDVLQAIEASRRQILAQASLEQLVGQLTKPTDAEIHDYYVKSPELFANHRIYKFAEISMASTVQVDRVKQLLSGTKSMEDFAAKLHNEHIEFKTATAIKGAEELPTALLPKFYKMVKNEVAIIPAGDSLSVLQLQDYKDQPLTEELARAVIGKFLLEQKRKTLLEAEMNKLRDTAKVEYVGAYADAGKARQDPAAIQAAPAANAAAELGKADAAKDSHVEKGLSGLK